MSSLSCRGRHRERGNSLVLAMIVLTALGTLSALTVVTVQGGIATTGNDRFHAIASYAAESGGMAPMDVLRKNLNLTTGWTAYVSPSNTNPPQPALPGNNQDVGTSGNLFSSDIQGWYSVQILNNRGDSGYATGTDNDKRVVIRSTGYGPNGAVAVVEWEISSYVGYQMWSGTNIVAVDWNGDGYMDFLLGSGAQGGSIRIFKGSCTRSATAVKNAAGLWPCTGSVTFSDQGYLISNLDTNHSPSTADGFGTNTSAGVPVFGYADVDGDDKRDLIVGAANCCTNAGYRLRSRSSMSPGPSTRPPAA